MCVLGSSLLVVGKGMERKKIKLVLMDWKAKLKPWSGNSLTPSCCGGCGCFVFALVYLLFQYVCPYVRLVKEHQHGCLASRGTVCLDLTGPGWL